MDPGRLGGFPALLCHDGFPVQVGGEHFAHVVEIGAHGLEGLPYFAQKPGAGDGAVAESTLNDKLFFANEADGWVVAVEAFWGCFHLVASQAAEEFDEVGAAGDGADGFVVARELVADALQICRVGGPETTAGKALAGLNVQIIPASQQVGGPPEGGAEAGLVRRFVFCKPHIAVDAEKLAALDVVGFAEFGFHGLHEGFHIGLRSFKERFVGLEPVAVVVGFEGGEKLERVFLNFHRRKISAKIG
jgi:hypothetical protein